MTNILVAFTPYHILLFLALMSARKEENNILFVVPEFPDAERFIKALKEESPFKEVILLPNVINGSAVKKGWARWRGSRIIREKVKSMVVDTVYVCNDARAESQTALYYAKRGNLRARGVYIEDGMAAYWSHTASRRILRSIARKVTAGKWSEEIMVVGTSSWIDESLLLFPKHARPELREKPILPFPQESLRGLRNHPFLAHIAERFSEQERSMDALFLPPHSKFFKQNPSGAEYFHSLLKKNKGSKIAVKYHPKEEEDFLHAKEAGAAIVSQEIPAELLYMILQKTPEYIIGDMTTALYTARLLLPKACIISVALLVGRRDERILHMFGELGIRLPTTEKEMTNLLL